MEENKALGIIQTLINGIDPETGELFPDDSPYKNPQIIKAFLLASDALKIVIKKKQRLKNLPKRAGKPWTEHEFELLVKRFDKGIKIKKIAKHHERSNWAIESKLLRMGKL